MSQKIQRADIVTVTLHINLESNLQKRVDLKPGNWPALSIAERHHKMKHLIDISHSHFRKHRLQYIETILEIVKFENDDVTKKMTSIQHRRRCKTCGKVFTNQKRKCDLCFSKVICDNVEEPRLATPESWPLTKTALDIGHSVNKNFKKMSMGEAVIVNPNSYASVEAILKKTVNGFSWAVMVCHTDLLVEL